MLQHNPELRAKIDQLWNKFWAGGISNPITAIEQITYLLFMRRLDDHELNKEKTSEFSGESYQSLFDGLWVPPEKRSAIPEKATAKQRKALQKKDEKQHGIPRKHLRWSEFKQLPTDKMLERVQHEVFPFLKDLNGYESRFTHHMKNAVFIIPKPSLLKEAISTIDDIFTLMEADNQKGHHFQDIQGDIYEYLLSEIAQAGKNGQFRTPRHIIKLMAELVQPQLGQDICDPACGTAGFLLGADEYMITQLALEKMTNKKDQPKPDEDGFIRTRLASLLDTDTQATLDSTLHGYDIDGTMVRLGLMNLIMHGFNEPQLDYTDTISKHFNETNRYDIVMANPPFTGNIDKGDINERLKSGTTKSELLFLENIYHLLKKGGTAGVIIPQGVLFGSAKAFKYVREQLVERCELKAVISMPSGVFKPYAGVSTAILIFTKVYNPEESVDTPATQQVWFYDMADDGYPLDDKRNKKDGYGDLQDIVQRYHKRIKTKKWDRTKNYFAVPYDEIVKENYDLSFSRYKEDVFEEIEYEAPEVIIERLLKAEVGEMKEKELKKVDSGIVKELLELREMIG